MSIISKLQAIVQFQQIIKIKQILTDMVISKSVFTVLDLLVIAAIVAVLLAIIVPVFVVRCPQRTTVLIAPNY